MKAAEVELKVLSETMQLVSFFLGDDEYGIHIEDIQEIIDIPVIRKLPQTASFIRGVINLRGNIVPVLDIRERFEMEKKEYDENTRVIILTMKGKSIGTIVDTISRVQVINKSEIEDPPDIICGISRRYLEGIGKIGKRMIVILNISKILTDEEFRTVSEAEVNEEQNDNSVQTEEVAEGNPAG